MTTLDFKDELTENAFSYSNSFTYSQIAPYGLFAIPGADNYPFILKGVISDPSELEFSTNNHQLRNRLLNTKKIKEVMNSSRLPLIFMLKDRNYLIGKGFLSTYTVTEYIPLFIACVDDRKVTREISQVKFFVSKKLYEEEHKVFHPVVKDLVGGHTGDVMIVNNILDYVGEKLSLPKGGSISDHKKYKEAVVLATLKIALAREEQVQPDDVIW